MAAGAYTNSFHCVHTAANTAKAVFSKNFSYFRILGDNVSNCHVFCDVCLFLILICHILLSSSVRYTRNFLPPLYTGTGWLACLALAYLTASKSLLSFNPRELNSFASALKYPVLIKSLSSGRTEGLLRVLSSLAKSSLTASG